MAVGEARLDRVVADGLDGDDRHVGVVAARVAPGRGRGRAERGVRDAPGPLVAVVELERARARKERDLLGRARRRAAFRAFRHCLKNPGGYRLGAFKCPCDLQERRLPELADPDGRSARGSRPGFLALAGRAATAALVAAAAASFALSQQDRFRIAVNSSGSMDGRVFLLDSEGPSPVRRGEVVVFAFDGGRWGFPDELWAKRVVGLPGDAIEVVGDGVFVAGSRVATLSPGPMERGNVSPVRAREVPPGSVFVVGSSPDSLDSRYLEFGFPGIDGLLGTATRLL